MSDQAQLIAQIRFAMEQLSERNAHHEWEHLCRHLARERICSNILPATGPVQAGGDQGRDFETFRTFLTRSSLGGRSFVGLISEKPLAFACTLEKKETLASKVRSDVTTIMSSGTSVEGIYMLCTRDMPVAKRHELQEWAQMTYSVSLEILDGAAISELLCDQDLFWLAERYLQLPTELLPMLPTGEEEKNWYERLLDKWRRETRPAQTFADFSEIRAAARTALGPFTYDDKGQPVHQHERPELPFWIERLDEIADQDVISLLQRRAFYETSVLRLRGLGSLIGQEGRLRLYFASIPQLEDAADLEDAEVLLSYMLPANRRGLVSLEDTEVRAWFLALEHRLDESLREVKKHDRVNEWCALLEVRGHIELFRHLLNEGVIDATETLKYWHKLAKLVTRAPLFPLERFADRLAKYALFIGTHPNYESITQEVDTLVAKRFGHFKAAEKCLERAIAFRKAGDLPRAMAQLHRAKIDWFAEETLGKSLQALDWLSRAYMEQGLFFAAKYYALATAYLIHYAQDLRLKSGIARSLERAASCDYALGAWHGFLELAEASAIVYPHFAHDPDTDFNNPHGVLQHLIFHLGLLPAVTKLLYPDLESFAYDRCTHIAQRLNLADVLEEVQAKAEEVWADMDTQKLWETIEEQLAGPPWSDSGPIRRAQWKAHGVAWSVQWANEYETTLAAEAFLAALQIFLSDLIGYDLCLMRSMLNISLHLTADDTSQTTSEGTGYKGFDTHFEPSNVERFAVVKLPSYRHFRDGVLSHDDLQVGALSVASSLLAEVSLLSTDQFDQVLNERFAQGLQNKLFIGASYGQCFNKCVSEEGFDASVRTEQGSFTSQRAFVSRLPEMLPWVDGPGPGYDPEKAQGQLRNRYDGFTRPIYRTLQRLVREPEFLMVVEGLRFSGWKDWHILSAIFHITMNYRLDHYPILLPNPEAEMAVSKRMISQPEPEDAIPVPLQEYEEEKLRQQLPIYMISFAKTYGLEVHQLTPDFTAIEDFLAHRYNFWTDDIEHDDPFKP